MSNPNTNCLDGFQCPECLSFGPFEIVVATTAKVTDDCCDVDGDKEWDDESQCSCLTCGHLATVAVFTGTRVVKIKGWEISWWASCNGEHAKELDECSLEHLEKKLSEGFKSGEICISSADKEYRGWWEVVDPEAAKTLRHSVILPAVDVSAVVDNLIRNSACFELMPLSDDEFEITVKPEAKSLLVPAERRALKSFKLLEAGEGEKRSIEVEVSHHDYMGTWLGFAGYGSCAEVGDKAAIVVFEQYNNELNIRVYGDINSEDPTHHISLEGARHDRRLDVLVEAVARVGDGELDDEDLEVVGRYVVTFDQLPESGDLAGAALDVFHRNVAVAVLDNFKFKVFSGKVELDQSDDYDSYSFTGSASIEKE